MITRQSCYEALFTLRNAGVEVGPQLEVMKTNQGIPKEIVEFLRDNSPQFQYYRYLQKHQRALMKNILDYESFDEVGKIKLCSSLITRVMIAIEYKEFDKSLMYDVGLEELSNALYKAINHQDFSKLDIALSRQRDSMRLFVNKKESEDGN